MTSNVVMNEFTVGGQSSFQKAQKGRCIGDEGMSEYHARKLREHVILTCTYIRPLIRSRPDVDHALTRTAAQHCSEQLVSELSPHLAIAIIRGSFAHRTIVTGRKIKMCQPKVLWA